MAQVSTIKHILVYPKEDYIECDFHPMDFFQGTKLILTNKQEAQITFKRLLEIFDKDLLLQEEHRYLKSYFHNNSY